MLKIAENYGDISRGSSLFGDDLALFLVILTIAGFFGLLLSMMMPFTFLMAQQGGFQGFGAQGRFLQNQGFGGNFGNLQGGFGNLQGFPQQGGFVGRKKRSTTDLTNEKRSSMALTDHLLHLTNLLTMIEEAAELYEN